MFLSQNLFFLLQLPTATGPTVITAPLNFTVLHSREKKQNILINSSPPLLFSIEQLLAKSLLFNF